MIYIGDIYRANPDRKNRQVKVISKWIYTRHIQKSEMCHGLSDKQKHLQ